MNNFSILLTLFWILTISSLVAQAEEDKKCGKLASIEVMGYVNCYDGKAIFQDGDVIALANPASKELAIQALTHDLKFCVETRGNIPSKNCEFCRYSVVRH